MPLDVLCCMKEQPHHGRRQLLAPDDTGIRQCAWLHRAQVIQCAIDLSVERIEQIPDADALIRLTALAGERFQLFPG